MPGLLPNDVAGEPLLGSVFIVDAIVSLKRYIHLTSKNMTLFGSRIFVDVISKGDHTHLGVGCAPNSMTGVVIRKGDADTEAYERRDHKKTKAEIRVMQPQAQIHLEPPKAGRGKKEPPLDPLEGAWLCNILISGLQPPELREDK